MNGLIVFLTITILIIIIYLVILLCVDTLVGYEQSHKYIKIVDIIMILVYLLALYINIENIFNNTYPNYLF